MKSVPGSSIHYCLRLYRTSLRFESDFGKYRVKLSDSVQYITRTFEWEKYHIDFQAYYRNLNMFFVLDTRFFWI